jgi:hypothetical protein
MNKILSISLLSFSYFSLYATSESLTDHILKACQRRAVLSGIDLKEDFSDSTIDGQELIKIKTEVHNLKKWMQIEYTELENKTLVGIIGLAIKSVKDDKNKKKFFLEKNTRCAYDKEIGSCACITVVTKEYFDKFKNADK